MGTQGGRRRRRSSALSSVSWTRGLGFGVAAGVVVLILSMVLFFLELALSGGFGMMGGQMGRVFVLLGLAMFWGSHLGAVPGQDIGLLGSGGAPIPIAVLYVIPVVVLLWIGRRAATGRAVPSTGAAGLQGASIASGYFLTVVGTVLLGQSMAPYGGIGAQLLRMVVVAGVVYPVVFGGIGGVTVAGSGGKRRAPRQPRQSGRQAQTQGSPRSRQPPESAGQRQDNQPSQRTQASARQEGDDAGGAPRQPQSSPGQGPEHGGGVGPHRGERADTPDQPTCPRCGAPTDPQSNYCRSCGSPLD